MLISETRVGAFKRLEKNCFKDNKINILNVFLVMKLYREVN